MRVIVRRASVDDAGALAGLRYRSTDEAGRPAENSFVDALSAWFSNHVATHLPFVAEADGVVVGVAWLLVGERVPSSERRRRFGDVQSVYVLPELRNQHIGTALLEAVSAEAGRLRLGHVTVHSSDRAVSLYQRAGLRHERTWLSWTPE